MRRTPEQTIALVRELGDMDPQRIAERLQVTPSAIYKAACIVGDSDMARLWRKARAEYPGGRRYGMPFEALVEALDDMAGESPEMAARRLGMTPGGVAKALQRGGLTERARPFETARQRLRKEAS